MYFQYLRAMTLLILIMCLFAGIPSISSFHSFSNDCDCFYDYLIYFSLQEYGNLFETKSNIVKIFNLVAMCLMIVYDMLFYFLSVRLAKRIDKSTLTSSDFTIMFENIPRQMSQEAITKYLSEHGATNDNLQIQKVSMCYRLNELISVSRNEIKVIRKIMNLEKDKSKNTVEIMNQKRFLEQIQKKKEALVKKAEENMADLFSGVVFVTVEREEVASKMHKRWSMHPLLLYLLRVFPPLKSCKANKGVIGGNVIVCKKAPEPSDIIWENLGISTVQWIKRRLFTFLGVAMVVGISFGTILGLLYAQDYVGSRSFVLSLGISGFILAINLVISSTLRFFVQLEDHKTYTSFHTSLAKKLSYAQFFNTALITFLVSGFIKDENLWDENGMYFNVFWILLINIIAPPLNALLNPMDFWKWLKTWLIRWRILKVTQKQAHAAFENPEMDIAWKYSVIFKTIALAMFYFPLVPMGLFFSLIALAFQFIVDKWLFLKRYGRPSSIGPGLAYGMVAHINSIVLVFGMGQFLFDLLIYSDFHSLSLVMLLLGISNWMFPLKLLIEFLFAKCLNSFNYYDKNENLTYSNIRLELDYDYDRMNPYTAEEANKALFREIEMVTKGKKIDLLTTQKKGQKNMFASFVQGLNNYAMHNYVFNQNFQHKAVFDEMDTTEELNGFMKNIGIGLTKKLTHNKREKDEVETAADPRNPNPNFFPFNGNNGALENSEILGELSSKNELNTNKQPMGTGAIGKNGPLYQFSEDEDSQKGIETQMESPFFHMAYGSTNGISPLLANLLFQQKIDSDDQGKDQVQDFFERFAGTWEQPLNQAQVIFPNNTGNTGYPKDHRGPREYHPQQPVYPGNIPMNQLYPAPFGTSENNVSPWGQIYPQGYTEYPSDQPNAGMPLKLPGFQLLGSFPTETLNPGAPNYPIPPPGYPPIH